jgi:hypothetical protein
MKYGIISWGNSSDSRKIFTLQKKIVRIMMGVKSHNSCGYLCEYIFPLIHFITNNEVHLHTAADVHIVDTSTVSTNQLLTSHAFRKAHITLEAKVSIICHLISKVL